MPLPSGGLWFAKGQRVQPVPLLEALLKLPGVYCKARSAAFLRRNAAGLWVVFDAQGNEIASAGNVVLANAAQASALLAAIPDIPLLNKLACMHKLAGQVAYFTAERSEEHTSELQSLMRISYAVFCLKKNKKQHTHKH